jgi:hypothetical protein
VCCAAYIGDYLANWWCGHLACLACKHLMTVVGYYRLGSMPFSDCNGQINIWNRNQARPETLAQSTGPDRPRPPRMGGYVIVEGVSSAAEIIHHCDALPSRFARFGSIFLFGLRVCSIRPASLLSARRELVWILAVYFINSFILSPLRLKVFDLGGWFWVGVMYIKFCVGICFVRVLIWDVCVLAEIRFIVEYGN